jgi:hypothetical protein
MFLKIVSDFGFSASHFRSKAYNFGEDDKMVPIYQILSDTILGSGDG